MTATRNSVAQLNAMPGLALSGNGAARMYWLTQDATVATAGIVDGKLTNVRRASATQLDHTYSAVKGSKLQRSVKPMQSP